MAHTKSAKKRIKTNEKKRVAHKARGTAVKTWTKKVLKAVAEGNKAQAQEELVLAYQRIDKAAKDRVIHPNAAARKKSLLARKVAALS